MAIGNFASEVLADGPSGYWRLGEPLGSGSAADETINHNDGTPTPIGVTFGLPGFHGGDTAALFNGSDGLIVVSNSESLNPVRITMEAKVRWDGPTGIQQRILEKESFGGTTQYGLSIQPDGHVFVELRMNDPSAPAGTITTVNATSSGLVSTGVETYIAATYDGLVIRIYFNGTLDSAKPINAYEVNLDVKWPHVAQDPEVDLAIGGRIGYPYLGHRNFKGLIDEVAIYPAALSAERILSHYQAQFAKQVILQYAAKFICGKSAGEVLAQGVYFTAVNVHNPTRMIVHFRVKMAVAWPGLKPGPVSEFYPAELGPDEALEIDCPDIFNPEIFRRVRTEADFLKGFIVIESDAELDVVAVYTVADMEGRVETLHTERVPPRRLEAVAG